MMTQVMVRQGQAKKEGRRQGPRPKTKKEATTTMKVPADEASKHDEARCPVTVTKMATTKVTKAGGRARQEVTKVQGKKEDKEDKEGRMSRSRSKV